MYSTLAYRLRPNSTSEVLGQKHILNNNGLIQRMIETKHPMSMIFYGPPGCGKTTLATTIANDLHIPYRTFNASTGNKKDMDAIISEAKLSDGLFVIIDEIHRLNKDKQDHLLPHIESGLLVVIGCTTANPYHSINPAIRSRCHLVSIKPLETEDVLEGLKRAISSEKGLNNEYSYDEEALLTLAKLSSGDIRYAYNCLELCSVIAKDHHIDKSCIEQANIKVNQKYDKDEDQYYDTLSGFQKSIRGSDPNGALYYLAKLIEANDIESLERRLLVIAYEDVGLANPAACARTVQAMEAAKKVGFPEARIIIASCVLDLALSPKSHSSENAIDAAMEALHEGSYEAPSYLRLSPVGLAEDERYDYGRPELWEYIQYLPDEIKNKQFYVPWMTSNYEKALAANYQRIGKHGRTNDIKRLNHSKRNGQS